jgi:DNA-binding NarL/FixJ family response regulator
MSGYPPPPAPLVGLAEELLLLSGWVGELADVVRLALTFASEPVRAGQHSFGFRAPRARSRPTTGWDALTKTESKVAQLIADGLSSPEISERLVISARTVDVHVGRMLTKLQVRSRVDVARLAAGRQQGAP